MKNHFIWQSSPLQCIWCRFLSREIIKVCWSVGNSLLLCVSNLPWVPNLERKRQHLRRGSRPPWPVLLNLLLNLQRCWIVLPLLSPPLLGSWHSWVVRLLNSVLRLRSTFPPAVLPVFSNVAPGPQHSAAPPHHDGPLKIHTCTLEEYQQIYHEVMNNMLTLSIS